MHAIDRITIKGYKSIRSLEEFELRRLNVLIGANGAGKSNFVGFFRLLKNMIQQRLQVTVAVDGGADACLFMGSKETKELAAKFRFGDDGYQFSLIPGSEDRLVFESESTGVRSDDWYWIGLPHFPDSAPSKRIEKLIPRYKKVDDGTRAAQLIGLAKMREQCPHFRDWINQLDVYNPNSLINPFAP